MAEIVTIRNPKAGRGAGERRWGQVLSLFEPLLNDRTVIHLATERAGHATNLAREAVDQGATTVVACGGDGTVNEVLNGMIDSGASLAVLPMGTGNDLCRSLGIGTDLNQAVPAALGEHSRTIDVGRWQCGGREGYFANICGSGFDAKVAERINRGFRYLTGTSAYIAAVLQTLMTYNRSVLHVTVDNHKISEHAMLCAVANAQSYGGGMLVAPLASLDDGLLDVVVVGDVSKMGFIRAFPRVFKGTHLSHPQVSHRVGRVVTIDSETPLPVLVDGELVGTTPATFTLVPRGIRVLVPSSQPIDGAETAIAGSNRA